MNWRCAIGLHDWEYTRATLDTETLDRQHKVHHVKIHGGGVKETRICRRCDKRQILKPGGMTEPGYWVTVPSHEWVQSLPPGQVAFRKD